MNLSKRITAIVSILMLVTTIGLGYTAITVSSNSIMQQTEATLLASAHEGAMLIEANINTELRILEELAFRPRTQTLNWSTQKESLMQDMDRLGYLDVGIVTPDGNTRYVLSDDVAALGDRDYVQRAFAGTSNVSGVIISRVNNQPVVMYAVPIVVDGEVASVLIARKDAKTFSETISPLGYGDNGYAFILGKDGTVYAHPDETQVLEQNNLLAEAGSDSPLGAVG